MFKHLQLILIGAAIIVALATLAGLLYCAFAYVIPAHPFALSITIALVPAWVIGAALTDNLPHF